MEYKNFYRSAAENNRFSIIYSVCEDNNGFFIESSIEGGHFCEKVFIESHNEARAEKIARLFAEKGVHPVHIEEIISDMRF